MDRSSLKVRLIGRPRPNLPRSRTSAAVVACCAVGLACGAWGNLNQASYSPPGRPAVARPAATKPEVYVQGDSLMVGIIDALPALLPANKLVISARIGRTVGEGIGALRAYARKPGLPQVVVLQLGLNNDPAQPSVFTAMIAQAMAVTGSSRCVIWVNLYHRTTTLVGKRRVSANIFTQTNSLMARAATRYKRLSIVDWAAAATRHPQWTSYDGVHPGPIGLSSFAQMIAGAVKNCERPPTPASNPTGGISPPQQNPDTPSATGGTTAPSA
ncbi:MAG: hypothetical protein WCK06_02275 [Actinomycetota bacterium]